MVAETGLKWQDDAQLARLMWAVCTRSPLTVHPNPRQRIFVMLITDTYDAHHRQMSPGCDT